MTFTVVQQPFNQGVKKAITDELMMVVFSVTSEGETPAHKDTDSVVDTDDSVRACFFFLFFLLSLTSPLPAANLSHCHITQY